MELGTLSVSLAVKDIAASRAFYEKLGFTVGGGDQDQKWLIMEKREHRDRPVRRRVRDDARLREVGFSRQKAAYARGVAQAIADGALDLAALDVASDDEVRRALPSIRGVGRWTAGIQPRCPRRLGWRRELRHHQRRSARGATLASGATIC